MQPANSFRIDRLQIVLILIYSVFPARSVSGKRRTGLFRLPAFILCRSGSSYSAIRSPFLSALAISAMAIRMDSAVLSGVQRVTGRPAATRSVKYRISS